MPRLTHIIGIVALALGSGCGPTSVTHGSGGGGGSAAAGGSGSAGGSAGGSGTAGGSSGGSGSSGGGGNAGDVFTVYTHSNTDLFTVDLANKTLVHVGAFKAPNSDTIQDLAISPNNVIYVIGAKTLYTADPNDGHVTSVASIGTVCGTDNVALTTTPDGLLFAGDYYGAFCKIDINANPPALTEVATAHKGTGWAISGDIVGISDGTVYGTAYDQDSGQSSTVTNNWLVKIDPTSGAITQQIGATGFPQLYGVAYAMGQVFGFTHDGTGRVITIDPKTGAGTLYNTFNDPTTGKPLSFAGAGVNSMVPPIQ